MPWITCVLPKDFFTSSTKMWSSAGMGTDGFGFSFGLRENKATPSRYHAGAARTHAERSGGSTPPRDGALFHGGGAAVLDTSSGPENTGAMTHDMLKTVLASADTKEADGWSVLPNGRLLSLYAAHDGVSLTVQKIEAVRVAHGLLHARNNKGETFMLALDDVFAAAFDAAAESKAARRAGFLG